MNKLWLVFAMHGCAADATFGAPGSPSSGAGGAGGGAASSSAKASVAVTSVAVAASSVGSGGAPCAPKGDPCVVDGYLTLCGGKAVKDSCGDEVKCFTNCPHGSACLAQGTCNCWPMVAHDSECKNPMYPKAWQCGGGQTPLGCWPVTDAPYCCPKL